MKDKEKTFRDFAKRASGWDLEQAYEQRPRKKRRQEKQTTRLPIKTQEGEIRPSLLQDHSEDEKESSGEGSDEEHAKEIEAQEAQRQPDIPTVPLKQQIIEGKEELAKIAASINEDPEGNVRINNFFKICYRISVLRRHRHRAFEYSLNSLRGSTPRSRSSFWEHN